MNCTCALMLALPLLIGAAVAQSTPADSEIVARISAATILILAGEGAGRLNAISTRVIVRPYGVILTAYHGIKNAREVPRGGLKPLVFAPVMLGSPIFRSPVPPQILYVIPKRLLPADATVEFRRLLQQKVRHYPEQVA